MGPARQEATRTRTNSFPNKLIRSGAVIFLLASVAVADAAPIPKELKSEQTIEGTWLMESVSSFGRPVQVGNNNQYWTIDAQGNMQSHIGPTVPDGARNFVRLVADPKLKTLDYTHTQATMSHPGVYEIVGDTLKIACNLKNNGGPRPLSTEAGPDSYVWTLKRVKSEAKK